MENKKPGLKSKILHIILFVLVIGTFSVLYYHVAKGNQSSKVIRFDEGWTVNLDDAVFSNVDLDELIFGMAKYGDKIVLTNTIPNDAFDRSALCLAVDYCATTIYVDGIKIFEYGYDLLARGDILGYGKQIVSLPDNCAGKPVKIVFYVTEEEEVTSLFTPLIYDETTLMSDYLSPDAIQFAISLSLVVGGLFLTLITFALFFRSYSMERLMCIGMFSLCIGLWSLANGGFTILFTHNFVLKTYLEYMSLYLSPIPILLYFREDVEQRSIRVESFIYYALMLIGIQLLLVSVLCQFMNWFHFPVFLRVYQTYMFICCMFILFVILQDMMREKQHKILLGGMLTILVIVIRDLIMFNVTKYGWFGVTDGSYVSMVAFGGLVFILSMVIDYIYQVRSQVILTAENEFLSRIAYMDVLTGLYTRRKCEEVFKEIDSSGHEYIIIQFDLNNLKSTNDRLGHEKGDELLIRFSKCLRKTYTSQEIIGRMGGDEFIVIVPNGKRYNVEDSFARLEKNIADDNAKSTDIKVSSSYGYCRSTEIPEPTARAVYIEADRKMYLAKQRYYLENGGRRRGDNR